MTHWLSVRETRLLLAASLIVACSRPAVPPPPPMEVTVVEARPERLEEPAEFMGAAEASRSVEVRAQVEGVILERAYAEGSFVRAGQVLFRIDPTQYEGAWRSARGRFSESEARRVNAERHLARLRPLLADNAVARRDVDDAEAEYERAKAAVEDARGEMDRAKQDLDETVVRAKLAGRVGRASLELGARVTGPDDVLTTIDALDPVYVSFRPTARQMVLWKRDRAGLRAVAPGGSARVQVTLPDGTVLPRTGRIDFIDPVVDPNTGTQQYRATFSNPDRALVPGQFVRVKVLGLSRENTIALPQRAIQQALGRQFVYLVGRGDTVAARDVETGSLANGRWIIEKGLTGGERVVVDGVQKIGPGAVVKTVPMPAAEHSASQPAANQERRP